jgi:bifunctional UDP-N-acetylglucosamine pyrophosphorylase/glucosamine-1-phosphate N-acetyltransferase
MSDPLSPGFAAVILAAGKSTRMKSKTPKPLHALLGKPLVHYAIDAARSAGAARIIVVVGHCAERVQAALGDECEFALQETQQGTGHAVQMAEPLLSRWKEPIVVLPGDAPLITPNLIRNLVDEHVRSSSAATLLTALMDDPGAYGRIIRDPESGRVCGIVEARDATGEQLQIAEIGTSVYAFEPALLFESLGRVRPNNVQGEYYLTDVVSLLADAGHRLSAVVSEDSDIVRGVNSRLELIDLAHVLQKRVHRAHLLAGVTIVDPATTFIEADVKIGQDTVVHPFSIISGVTDIGEDCQIGPGARISDSRIGNGVAIRDSYVTASEVGDDSRIGPYANLRPGNIIGRGVKVGDFVELKKATLEDGVSAGHLAYLGDATIGARTNVGAGVITCNYDGANKLPTVVGDDAFLGSNVTLVAPVTVGDEAFIAAGSVITGDVEPGALAFGRARQVNKEGRAPHKGKSRGEH